MASEDETWAPPPRACQSASDPCTRDQIDREFELRCNANQIAKELQVLLANAHVRGVLHIGTSPQPIWREVLWDQVRTLQGCGLLNVTAHVHASLHAPPGAARVDTADVARKLSAVHPSVSFSHSNRSVPWEFDALEHVTQACREEQGARHPSRTLVYYLHTKGVTRWNPDWVQRWHPPRARAYQMSLYWRKYMEYYLFENPHWCVAALLGGHYLDRKPEEGGALTCGVDFSLVPFVHYGGNFFWARCDYVLQLPGITPDNGDYYASERYIGMGVKTTKGTGKKKGIVEADSRHVSLFDKYQHANFYQAVVHRDVYARRHSHFQGQDNAGLVQEMHTIQDSGWPTHLVTAKGHRRIGQVGVALAALIVWVWFAWRQLGKRISTAA